MNGYLFNGPYAVPQELDSGAGVFIVLGLTDNQNAIIVDIGESDDIRHAVETHTNKACWEKLSGIALAFGSLQMSESNDVKRTEAVDLIRSKNKTIF